MSTFYVFPLILIEPILVSRQIFPDTAAENSEPNENSMVARMRNQAKQRRLVERQQYSGDGLIEGQEEQMALQATNGWEVIDPQLIAISNHVH